MKNEFSYANHLLQRTVPWLQNRVDFSGIPCSAGEADCFELSCDGFTLHAKASSKSALFSSVNHYLKYFCHRSASHCGNNLSPVSSLPKLPDPIRLATPFTWRYALNYCTYNYTMAFWKWEQWEKELDWMALQGVNLMLIATGIRAVWQKLLERYHFTEEEIVQFCPGPAYTSWWLMGNLEGWGGPATRSSIEYETELTRKIIQRMHELGIVPVYHGFYGMVPRLLGNKIAGAGLVDQGRWNNAFERPAILPAGNPLFEEMAVAYYSIVEELYGKFLFFGGDPFHEGGNTKDINLPELAHGIQWAMQKSMPGSTWVLQAWYANPKQELLDGADPEKLLILDLFGEVTRIWKEREAFGGVPFLWCSINNFGENTGINGRLEKIAAGPAEVLESDYSGFLKGIGILPEGIQNNPVVYDMVFDAAWRPLSFDVKKWLEDYTCYRYGSRNETIIKAWQLFLETVYASSEEYREGGIESIFCARPSFTITSASTWGSRTFRYNPEKFEKAVSLFAEASDMFRQVDTYRYDLVDFTRQVVSNRGQKAYDGLIHAHSKGKTKEFQLCRKALEELIAMQDDLLSTHPAFMLGSWLRMAKEFSDNETEKYLCELNARVLITWWGPDDPASSLHDYAHKEWSGLLRDFYLPRWQIFFDACQRNEINNEELLLRYFLFEKSWSQQRNEYPVLPAGDCVEKALAVLEKLVKTENANTVRH